MGDHVPAFIAREIDVAALIRASSRGDDDKRAVEAETDAQDDGRESDAA